MAISNYLINYKILFHFTQNKIMVVQLQNLIEFENQV